MDPIFLTPESTFSISVTTEIVDGIPRFNISDGGGLTLRTVTGREFNAIQGMVGRDDADGAYTILEKLVQSGIGDDAKTKEDRSKIFAMLHPSVVWSLLLYVLKRSRISEIERGK